MAVTTKAQVRSVSSVDEYPEVRRQRELREQLKKNLEKVQADLTILRAEREAIATDLVSRRATSLLRDPGVSIEDDGYDGQLAHLDTQIAGLAARVSPLELALKQHLAIAAGVREEAQREVKRQVQAAVRAVVDEMRPLVQKIQALNGELETLHGRTGEPVPVLVPSLVQTWLDRAKA